MTDLIRARTELECTVEDLKLAADRAGGKREELQNELATLQAEIGQKEVELEGLKPEWGQYRTRENEEKRELDAARARLETLFAKRGRMGRFTTKGERDRYLRSEIASVEAYRASQTTALATSKNDLDAARNSLGQIERNLTQAQDTVEDGREQVKKLAEEIAQLKDSHANMSERRKTLWREETRLRSVVDNLNDEFRSAERLLASMMDKVSVPAQP